MSRTGAYNLAAAVLSVGCSMWLGLAAPVEPGTAPAVGRGYAAQRTKPQPAGLYDASGHFVALAGYRRIVSTSPLADGLLLALCEPDRVAAYTRRSARQSASSYRYAGRPVIEGPGDLEAVLALKPDLVLTNGLVAGRDRIARLRQSGLVVFDLGEMKGLATLLPNIVAVATLLGRSEVGRELAARFEGRMRAVANGVPMSARPRGAYVSVYGDVLYGGTDGTSFHDVLTAAGVHDAAAGRYHGWPRFAPEALLSLDPELIVTHKGMARALCSYAGLDQLRACRQQRVVEIDATLIADPGLAMLEAAEDVFNAVHGRTRVAAP